MKLLFENWKNYLNEDCWQGYTQKGMKKKGNRMVPNCVPMQEEGTEQDLNSKVKKALEDEGGAAGMKALKKHTKASKKEVEKAISDEPKFTKHTHGDIILKDDSLDEDLRKWFGRKGAPGKKKGWVDCNTCRKDKSGKKTCKACGREKGEKRKYPACRATPAKCGKKGKWGKKSKRTNEVKLNQKKLKELIQEEIENLYYEMHIQEGPFYEVDALNENEEYCPECRQLEEKKKKPCKPSKGKRFAKRVNGKCRSFGQAGKAKKGGDRIRPGTKKGDAYCARSAKIKKCKNPPCANTLSRKKWKCRGSKSVAEE